MHRTVFVLPLGLALLAGCSDENARLRGEFLSGCVQAGSQKSACECVFGRLEARYSPQELQALNRTQVPPEHFKQTVGQALMACRDE